MYKINKLQGYLVQHGKYSQYLIITINGVQPLKMVNHYVVPLKVIYNTVYQLYLNKIFF